MTEPTSYLAWTARPVEPRQTTVPPRASQQASLLDAVAALNAELQHVLVRPVALTAGDEIQGLLRVPSRVMECLQRLEDALAMGGRLGLAVGIGWGPLATGLQPQAAVEPLDGPCFHHARSALERAQKTKRWAVCVGFGPPFDEALSSLFELMGATRSSWTATQAAHTVELRALGKRIAVARARDVSPSVVTESLQSARYDAVAHGEDAVRALLARFDPPDHA